MSYKTRLEAVEASVDLGGKAGAHKAADGGWNPCKTEELYKFALKNQEEENAPLPFSKSTDQCKVCKVDTDRKLVFGWAQICTKNQEPYYDTDNQFFPEDVTLGDSESGWTEFMMQKRVHKAMHDGESVGDVVFAFPAFNDVMKSLGFETINQTGVIAGVYVSDTDTLQKFHSGEFTGFSIGGSATFIDEEED